MSSDYYCCFVTILIRAFRVTTLQAQYDALKENTTQLVGMMLISHLTMTNAITAANSRISSFERRLSRGATGGQRTRRTGVPNREYSRGEGSRDRPIILDMDDDERLRRGLPPGTGRPDTLIPGLGRVSLDPIPIPEPRLRPRASGLGLHQGRRFTSEVRARWLRPIEDSDSSNLYD